jgi:hypothetical protein
LAPELLLGTVKGGTVIGPLSLGDEHLPAGHVQPNLDRQLDAIGIEHDR